MNKKEMIMALEEKWGTKATYLGTPSFAYEIKSDTQTYIIDRYGVVRDLQGCELPADELLGKPQPEPESKAAPAKQDELGIDEYAVEFPLADHTGGSLRNLVNMISSKQKLIVSAFGLTHWLMDNLFAEELSQKNIDSVELFQESFLELGPDRCPCFEIDGEKRTVALKLAKKDLNSDEMAAFRDLAVCVNQNAQKLKTSSYQPAQMENPKYALRTWLIRLGMNGEEFKKTRKTILTRLDGNSAFRSPKAEVPLKD